MKSLFVLVVVLIWPGLAHAVCPPGSFYDPQNSGECWQCPSGFSRTIFSVSAANACEAVLPATFSPAGRQGREGCEPGDIRDGIRGGSCWRCPLELVRTVSAVDSPQACGRLGEILGTKLPATFIKNVGCSAGEFPDLGWCWTCPSGSVRGIVHIEWPEACVVPARTVVRPATLIGRVACGRLDERACAIVGRSSCDPGLVEFDNTCRTAGDCGTEGKRRCLAGEPGAWEPLTGCAIALVPTNNICTRPACGRLDEQACSIPGRSSCDPGLVEVNNRCFTRGACGAADQRACLIGERNGPSCDPNLVERNGTCIRTDCGGLGQQACAIVGRNSCDVGLADVLGRCQTPRDCGAEGQRLCFLFIDGRGGCNTDLVDVNGRCFAPAPRPLEVSRFNTSTLTNADADRILDDATRVILTNARVVLTNAGADDVSCLIRLFRNGNVTRFKNGNGIINSEADFNTINGLAGRVKVVNQINWCSGLIPNVIGCAPIPGNSQIVVRFIANQEGILWAHEYGHTRGLGHVTGATSIMNDTLWPTHTMLTKNECNAFDN